MESLKPLLDCFRDDSDRLQGPADWPCRQLKACGEFGLHRFFQEAPSGGLGLSAKSQLATYVELAKSCLTTTFILTQRAGAVRRIASGASDLARETYLEPLLNGSKFATVGISHLTTSRQHVRPVMQLRDDGEFVILDGVVPWVTGASHADLLVVGAIDALGKQTLIAVPTDIPGIQAGKGAELIALSASCTDQVTFDSVRVHRNWILAGPADNVMQTGAGANTGGLQTTALALGLAGAACDFVNEQSQNRPELTEIGHKLSKDRDELCEVLFQIAEGMTNEDMSPMELRRRANLFTLRATQAAMVSAKGAGFLQGHPVGRWSTEALFFLVWSCPQPVAESNLCELAGVPEH